MNRISPEVEAKIIEMWFEGFPRDEIARVLMVGEGTVTAKLNSLPPCLTLLRDLAKALRKLNLLPGDALKGVNVLQLLKEHLMDPEQMPIILEAIKKASKEAGYRPEEVIKASMELVKLENESGKRYPEALKEFRTITQQIPELRREISKVQVETVENIQRRNETLRRANTTQKELTEYFDCKAALHDYGMNIKDAKTTRQVLDNFKEAGGNSKHLVSLVKKRDSIAKSLAAAERQLPAKREEYAYLEHAIKELRQVILQLQENKRQLDVILTQQRDAINRNDYQLNLILANVAQLERRRQGLIAYIGKKLNLPQEKIENLRLNSEFEIVLQIIDNEMRDALRSLRASLTS